MMPTLSAGRFCDRAWTCGGAPVGGPRYLLRETEVRRVTAGPEAHMFDYGRDIPRAYTVPGIPHPTASMLGVKWAIQQAEALAAPLCLFVPSKQNLRDSDHEYVNALIARGVPVHTWRDWDSGSGLVIALWPDEERLLRTEESTATQALVAVTWNAKDVLGWAQAKGAEPLGGTPPDMTPFQSLDPVVAEAIDGLGVLVGQHKTADRRYRAVIAKGLTILRSAGYALDPEVLHTHAIGHGWRASNADILRDIATRLNAGRIIGVKSALLRDDILDHWREQAANRTEE